MPQKRVKDDKSPAHKVDSLAGAELRDLLYLAERLFSFVRRVKSQIRSFKLYLQ
jgi:hypothetical protein